MAQGTTLDWPDSSDSEQDDWGWNAPVHVESPLRDRVSNSGVQGPLDVDAFAGCLASLVLVENNNNPERRSKVRRARQTRRGGEIDRGTTTGCAHTTPQLLRAGELGVERIERAARERVRSRAMEQEKSKAAAAMPFRERCARDSLSLLHSAECPEHFRAVDQLFPKLEPAKTCANQHNLVGIALPEKEVVFSRCGDVPDRHRKTGLLRFGGWDDFRHEVPCEGLGASEALEALEASPPEVLFDFRAKELEGNSDVYLERVDVSKEQEETAEDLKRKYLDILGKLNVDYGKKKTKNGEDKEREKKGKGGGEGEGEGEKEDPGPRPLYPPDYPQALRIFAIQDFSKFQDEPGRKKTTYRYRVCPLSKAWSEMKGCEDQSKMHWYEVIREGFPCHMYFDLEYPKAPGLNEGLDDDALVDTLLGFVRKRLRDDFDLELCEDRIYELDSTTERKFSRHLIVQVPGYAFYNVEHVGYFVQQVCADSGNKLLLRQNLDSDRMGYVVDTAVYTKNRLFRLAYNCKCGGTGQTLQPTQRFATADPQTPAHVFSSTLVTNMGEEATGANLKLLAVRRMLTMPQVVHDATNGIEGGVDGLGGPVGTVRAVEEKPVRQDINKFMPPREAMNRLSSLARQAIPFIQKYATDRAGKPASVKSWQILGGYGDVAYSLAGPGAHFCSNKGGDHNSNFVYVVANFYLARVAQKCFDQETCYKYKSPYQQMPEKFRWRPDL